jgi:hypothetical protein
LSGYPIAEKLPASLGAIALSANCVGTLAFLGGMFVVSRTGEVYDFPFAEN